MSYGLDLSCFLVKVDTTTYCKMQVTATSGQQTVAKARWNSQDVEARKYVAFKAASKT